MGGSSFRRIVVDGAEFLYSVSWRGERLFVRGELRGAPFIWSTPLTPKFTAKTEWRWKKGERSHGTNEFADIIRNHLKTAVSLCESV